LDDVFTDYENIRRELELFSQHTTTSSQPSPSWEKEQATDDTHVALLSSKGEEIQR